MKRTFVFALSLAACGGGPATIAPPPATAPKLIDVEAVRWLPAEDGALYAYETRDLVSGTRGVMNLRARRLSPTAVDLVGPRHTEHLSYGADGIKRVAEGTFLLRTPVTEGTTWPGGPNASFKIARVGAAVKVAAGEFDRCAEVVETRSGAIRGTITTVFCADVGIVRMETQGVAEGGATTVHESLELTSFGKAVDIGAPGVTKTPVK